VEHRARPQELFGRGRKRRMRFGDALRAASCVDPPLYPTTQDAPSAPDSHPDLLNPPLSHLAADSPPRPALLANLVPQSINQWVGSAPPAHGGASSPVYGPHRDPHDNLCDLAERQGALPSVPTLPGGGNVHSARPA
jgi:hypothetical protein